MDQFSQPNADIKLNSSVPWSSESTMKNDFTLHQIAPYIGRMKISIAKFLIDEYTIKNDLIIDPFCGSGVVPLEAACKGRQVIANDWNPYGCVLTRAKLFPPKDENLARKELQDAIKISREKYFRQDLRKVPSWVRQFFHPKTLKETLAFRDACLYLKNDFLLACMLGILHHQRPGFLSYPSSHLVPYLRTKKFPKNEFSEMYEYRDLVPRMEAKIKRTFRRFPENELQECQVYHGDARKIPINKKFNALITSPPYMNLLDYVRDNRLRLWFLDETGSKTKEIKAKNRVPEFRNLMKDVMCHLSKYIVEGGYIILLLGDVSRGKKNSDPVTIVKELFDCNSNLKEYSLVNEIKDVIPDIRRSRRDCKGGKTETVLVYKRGEQSEEKHA